MTYLDTTITAYFEGSAPAGTNLPVDMPVTVDAGDYLFAFSTSSFVATPPAGWTTLVNGQAWWKLADGSEGGTSPNWVTLSGTHDYVQHVAVMRYRFNATPTLISQSDQINFGDLTDGGLTYHHNYPNNTPVSPSHEIRIYFLHANANLNHHTEEFGTVGENLLVPDHAWTNATERVTDDNDTDLGVVATAIGTWNRADTILLADRSVAPGAVSNSAVDIDLFPDGGQVVGRRIRITFAEDPEERCIAQTLWGYAATAGELFSGPNAQEDDGFVRAATAGAAFGTASPPGGALLIATVKRYSFNGATPPSGTLSGFGATWDLIYHEDATGNGGAAFTEVYRAQQASYTTGVLEYSFPPNAWQFFSSVGYDVFVGTDPAGLTDNGASGIMDVTSHGPASATTGTSYSHPSVYRDTGSLLWSAFWRMDSGGTTGFLTLDEPFLESHGSTARNVTLDRGIAEQISFFDNSVTTNTWSWEAGQSRTWFAATLELLADPECVGIIAPAYWGIHAVPL